MNPKITSRWRTNDYTVSIRLRVFILFCFNKIRIHWRLLSGKVSLIFNEENADCIVLERNMI